MNQVTRFALLAAGLCSNVVAQTVLFHETLQDYREYTEATTVLGYDAHVATADEWNNMTTADFAAYDAIIFSDPDCGDVSSIQFAVDTRSAWSPAVGGNIIILGTDPSLHAGGVAGAVTLIDNALRFSVNSSSTGLYFALSCYYAGDTDAVTIEALTEIGEFTSRSSGGCFNDVHLVASSPAISTLTDEDLSNWGCSIHEVIPTYPSEFAALAIARGATGDGEQTFADGSTGVPYIIARGVTPSGCGNGLYQPAFGEECDHGESNGLDNDTCDITCKCIYGVDDADLGTCLPDPTPSSTPTPTFSITSVASQEPLSTTPTNATTTSSGSEISTSTTSDISTSTLSEIPSSSLDITSTVSESTTTSETELPSLSSTLEVPTTPISSITSFPSLPSFPNSTFTPSSTAGVSASSSSSAVASAEPTGTSSAPPASSSSAAVASFPPSIDSYNFLGCAGSSANYATFSLALASDDMDLDLCVETCAGSAFAGAYNTECYCAESFEDIVQLDSDQCDIPCPGNDTQFCGGSRSLARRQVGAPPETALLAVYVNPELIAAASGLPTSTAVVTATATGVTTVSGANPVSTTVVCVNGYCEAGYIFEICTSIPAAGEVVFVIESCSCPGGSRYVPAPCSGEACLGLTVYRPVPCPPQHPTGVVVYQPKPCDECKGGVTFVQPVNTTVTTLVPATTARTVEVGTATGTAIVVVAGGSKVAASIGSLVAVLGAFAFLI